MIYRSLAAELPLSLTIGVIALFSILLVLATGEMPMYIHGLDVPGWQPAVIAFSEVAVITLWAVADLRYTDYFAPSPERPAHWFWRHFRRLPLLAAGFIVSVYALRHAVFWLLGAHYGHTGIVFIIIYEALKLTLLYCCWLGLMYGIASFVRMKHQAEHLLAAERTLSEAKLTQLQAQLRPHFLFNALNTVSATMQVDVAASDRLLTRLSDLLRASLNAGDASRVRLSEELRLLRQYGDIMEARFVDRVRIEWQIGADTLDASVPAMLLQPLLENAFKHGVERASTPERICVHASREQSLLHVRIHNSGSVLAPDHREGWGLRSTRERLQLLYGASATLTLRNHAAGGVEVSVTLPWTEVDA